MDTQSNVSNNLAQYDELASKHKAAFAAFCSIYEDKVPPPVYIAPERDSQWLLSMLALVMLCSLIVSGSRTVNLFGGGVVGFAAFGMLEGSIVAFTFFGTRNNYNESQLESVNRWAKAGAWLGVIMTIASNVGGSMLNAQIELPFAVIVSIDVALALAAPVLAFIIGHIVAVQTVAHIIKTRKSEREYKATYQEWLTGRNEDWARQKARWGVKVQVVESPQISAVNLLNLTEKTDKRERTSPQLDKAIGYLRERRDLWTSPSRELVAQIGVSHVTIFKAQQALLSGENAKQGVVNHD